MTKKVASPTFTFSSRSRQHLPYRSIITVVILAAIIGSLSFSRGMWRHSKKVESSAKSQVQQATMDGGTSISYVAVSSGRGDVRRYAAIKQGSSPGEPISIRSWMTAVASNSSAGMQAASDLSSVITSSPYSSVLFETPGSSWQSSSDQQFEFALVDQPALKRFAESNPDRYAFAEHFSACTSRNEKDTVCSFANLGGDAHLVAPLPQTNVNDNSYSHLAAFVRNAPKSQVAEFWKSCANEHLAVLESRQKVNPNAKTWFSTNGMGVAWLHLRLDSRPKYYSYGPFRR